MKEGQQLTEAENSGRMTRRLRVKMEAGGGRGGRRGSVYGGSQCSDQGKQAQQGRRSGRRQQRGSVVDAGSLDADKLT